METAPIFAWPGCSARSVTPGAAFVAFSDTAPYDPSAKHTTEPGAADETAAVAAETLDTVCEHAAALAPAGSTPTASSTSTTHAETGR